MARIYFQPAFQPACWRQCYGKELRSRRPFYRGWELVSWDEGGGGRSWHQGAPDTPRGAFACRPIYFRKAVSVPDRSLWLRYGKATDVDKATEGRTGTNNIYRSARSHQSCK